MRRDAHEIRDGAVLHGDICIGGGGPAGITLARELIGHSAGVICLCVRFVPHVLQRILTCL